MMEMRRREPKIVATFQASTLFQFHFHSGNCTASLFLFVYAHLQIAHGNNEIWSSQFSNVAVEIQNKNYKFGPKSGINNSFPLFLFSSLFHACHWWLVNVSASLTASGGCILCFVLLLFSLFEKPFRFEGVFVCVSNFFQWIFGHMCMTTINFCQCHETYRIAFCPW